MRVSDISYESESYQFSFRWHHSCFNLCVLRFICLILQLMTIIRKLMNRRNIVHEDGVFVSAQYHDHWTRKLYSNKDLRTSKNIFLFYIFWCIHLHVHSMFYLVFKSIRKCTKYLKLSVSLESFSEKKLTVLYPYKTLFMKWCDNSLPWPKIAMSQTSLRSMKRFKSNGFLCQNQIRFFRTHHVSNARFSVNN